jgi:hypothetical protein
MAERRDDGQLRLSLRPRLESQPKKNDINKKDRPIVDLTSLRTSRHGTTILERVIREGFTKKK